MKVMVVYCHHIQCSFTYEIKENFIRGLYAAGHEVEVADLYADDFQSDMCELEYLREGFYNEKIDVMKDVRYYQEMINRQDAMTFIYPVFWSEAPSKLVGWFQRVWTYGFAYGKQEMKVLKKVLFLVTMGGDARQVVRQRQIEAMKEVMINDRIANRAQNVEFIIYDRMSRGYRIRQQKYNDYLLDACLRGKEF